MDTFFYEIMKVHATFVTIIQYASQDFTFLVGMTFFSKMFVFVQNIAVGLALFLIQLVKAVPLLGP